MTEEDTLAAEVIIGDEADKFLRSELGRTLIGIAQQQALAATDELKRVDPLEVEKIRNLQAEIWRAEGFEDWLRSLVRAGEIAMNTMELEEHE